MEGFLEAGPQLALQLSMLVQGKTSQSKQILWERHIGQYGGANTSALMASVYEDYENMTTLEPLASNMTDLADMPEPGQLQIFGRVYNEGNSWSSEESK